MATNQRKTPLRTCVACRATRPKRELLRLVRTPDGDVRIDQSGKTAGRGASVCPSEECFSRAIKTGALARSLQVGVDKECAGRLRSEFEKLLAGNDAGAKDK